jgi:hypothetical protein
VALVIPILIRVGRYFVRDRRAFYSTRPFTLYLRPFSSDREYAVGLHLISLGINRFRRAERASCRIAARQASVEPRPRCFSHTRYERIVESYGD